MHGALEEEIEKMITAKWVESLQIPKLIEEKTEQGGDCTVKCEDGGTKTIYSSGNTIVISSENGLLDTISSDFKVNDSFWFTFPQQTFGEKDVRECFECLCIVGDSHIDFVTPSQSRYSFTLPFRVRKAFPSPFGLLIERESDPEIELEDSSTPRLFSLSHPFNEILPILYNLKDEWAYAFDREGAGYMIVGTSKEFLLVYDTKTALHSVYKVRKSDETEWQSARKNEIRRMELRTPRQNAFTPDRSAVSPAVTPLGGIGMRTRSMTATKLAKSQLFSKQTPTNIHIFNTPKSVASVTSNQSFNINRYRLGTPSGISTSFYGSMMEDNDLPGTWGVDLCLDVIWNEVSRADRDSRGMASKMFLSSDFVSYTFLHLIVPSSNELRSLRVIYQNGIVTGLSPPTTIPCKDATVIENSGLIVLTDEHGTMTLYTGVTRLCIFVVSEISTPSRLLSLSPSGDHSFLCTMRTPREHICVTIPSITQSSIASQLWSTVVGCLPHDKALKMACEYRFIAPIGMDAQEERRFVFTFLLDKMGIRLTGHPWMKMPENKPIESSESVEQEEVASKQKCRVGTEAEKHLEFVRSISNKSGVKMNETTNIEISVEIDSSSLLSSHLHVIFSSIHCLYEELKMRSQSIESRNDTLHFLYAISRSCSLVNYSSKYMRECKEIEKFSFSINDHSNSSLLTSPQITRQFSSDHVFCIFDTFEHLLTSHVVQTLPSNTTVFVSSVILATAVGLCRVVNKMDLQRLLGKNYGKRLRLDTKGEKTLLDTIAMEGVNAAQKCERILHLFSFSKWDMDSLPSSIALVVGDILLRQIVPSEMLHKGVVSPTLSLHPTQLEIRHLCSLRWPFDIRSQNVDNLLTSERPFFIPIPPVTPKGTDAEIRDLQENFVLAIAIRTMTQAFGRALIHFRSEIPAPNDVLRVTPMFFGGRTYQTNMPVELAVGDSLSLRIARDWGDFFNGVATALSMNGKEEEALLGEWIQMCYLENQKTTGVGTSGPAPERKNPSASAAGTLLGFGLNGHLPALNIYNIHELLSQQDRLISVAILIGFSVSMVGTADVPLYRILATHLPFLMGPTMLDVNIEPVVQTSAIISLGILFAEKANATLIGQLLNEIGKAPLPDVEPPPDRYSYALSAGFSLGLIGLGHGNSLVQQVSIVQKRADLVERLLVLMEGGPRNRCVFNTDVPPNIHHPTESVNTLLESNHTRERDRVNVHLTAHPATIALGLLFLKTGNKEVAFLLNLPRTITALEEIRPDVIPIRVLAHAMVMWDEIEGTMEWIEEQIPVVVRRYAEDAIGVNTPGRRFTTKEDGYWEEVVDRETIAQTYCHCIAGACFALSLKFASTHDNNVKKVILHYLSKVIPEEPRQPSYELLCRLAGTGVTNMCYGILLASLSIVMAGSGDVDVLRLCRLVRHCESPWAWHKNSFIHSQLQNVHMCMGLLFMGASRFCLKRDNMSIASLIIAFYPMANHHIADNRLYLQPLRFLWTLASCRTLLCTVDSKNEQPVVADVNIEFKKPLSSGIPTVLQTPCMLPPIDEISRITVGGGPFETLIFDSSNKGGMDKIERAMKQHYGRLPIARLKSETEPLVSVREYLMAFDTEQVTSKDCEHGQWTSINEREMEQPVSPGSGRISPSEWYKKRLTVDGDVEEWITLNGAFPLKHHLYNLHKELLCSDTHPLAVSNGRLASVLAHSRQSKAIGVHMVDRLVDVLREHVGQDDCQSLNKSRLCHRELCGDKPTFYFRE